MIDVLIWLETHPNVFITLERMDCSYYDGGLLKITMIGNEELGKTLAASRISLKELALLNDEDLHSFIPHFLDSMYAKIIDARRKEFKNIVTAFREGER